MLLSNLNLLATAPDGVARLRELILTLAVQGKLVPQDPKDEAASELLKKIRAEKDRLITEGKIKRDKPLAEITEEEKPFELPEGWEWVRLGAAMEMFNGKAFKPTDWLASGLPIVRIQNLNRSEATFNYCDPATISEKNKIDSGSFLISWSGTPGTSFGAFIWQRGPAALNQHIFKCELLGNAFVPEFLELSINSQLNVLIGKAQGGVGLQHVTKGALESLVLVVPPLAEQSRIVTRVEELMRLCDALEAKARLEATQHEQLVRTLLGTLTASTTPEELADNWHRVATHFDLLLDRPAAVDALEQTILQLAVRGLLVPQDPQDEPASSLMKRLRSNRDTWLAAQASVDSECRATIKKLRDLPDADEPFPIPSNWSFVRLLDCCRLLVDCHNKTAPYAPHGIPIIRTSNIRGGRFRLDDLRYVTEETYDFWSRRCPPESGDIMFTREAPMGEAAIIPPGAKYCLGQRTMLLRPMHEFIDKEYLLLALTEPHLLERAAPSAIGSTVKHLRVGDVEGLTIPLPPIAEQTRIVARVASLRTLCADLRQRLTTARTQQALLAEVLVKEVA